eukprot:RCo027235
MAASSSLWVILVSIGLALCVLLAALALRTQPPRGGQPSPGLSSEAQPRALRSPNPPQSTALVAAVLEDEKSSNAGIPQRRPRGGDGTFDGSEWPSAFDP